MTEPKILLMMAAGASSVLLLAPGLSRFLLIDQARLLTLKEWIAHRHWIVEPDICTYRPCMRTQSMSEGRRLPYTASLRMTAGWMCSSQLEVECRSHLHHS
jgi:hypothetical protein